MADDSIRVAAGANDIAEGFHVRAAIDVGDDVVPRVLFEEGLEFLAGAGVGEGATRVFVGEDDDFLGVEDFGSLGHEVDPAKKDDIRLGLLGLVGEAEGIAHVVRDFLDVGGLVVVREDDGVFLFFERDDFFLACVHK